MQNDKMKFCWKLRHELHENAELSGKEQVTSSIIKQFLRDNTALTVIEKDNYFYAVHKCGEGFENIAFRADIDAVPVNEDLDIEYKSKTQGVSHKCGHDGHSTVIAAIGLFLDEIKDKNVYLLFQPSEEVGTGAKKIVEDNFLEDNKISRIYGFHNIPGSDMGRVLLKEDVFACASKGMEIILHGTPAHAAYPEFGINPAYAISDIVTFIRNVCSNEDFSNMVLCTIVNIQVGERAFGTSAGEGSLLMTIRGEDEKELRLLDDKIRTFSDSVCTKYGIRSETLIHDEFPETRNYNSVIEDIENVCKKQNIDFENISEPFRWSEDFGYYLKNTEGAIIGIGSGNNQPQLHTKEYDFPDELIEKALKVMLTICRM